MSCDYIAKTKKTNKNQAFGKCEARGSVVLIAPIYSQ
jgi:hypothetical protein